jgi:diguanylate cyclase (GGDEF)-like protein
MSDKRTGPIELGSDYLMAVLAQVQVPIVVTDPQGGILLTNDAWRAYHPVPATEVAIDDWLGRFQFFDADGIRPIANSDAPLPRVLRGERVRNFEYSVLSQDGELRFRRANGQQLLGPHGDVIGAVVAFHDTTDERKVEREMRHRALHDSLTGLANRALLLDRLDHALARGARLNLPIAVILCDIDRFKRVNDAFGHHIGDRLLVEISRRLQSIMRGTDTVARLGGDEFVILVEDLDVLVDLAEVARRIRESVSEVVAVMGAVIHPTISLGIAGADSGQSTAEELLRDADIAMYRAKESGGNTVATFDESMHKSLIRRMHVQREIEWGLENDRLFLMYQPIVDAATERLVGTEALLRLESSDGSLLSPAEFIPVAEEARLIDRFDRFALLEATRQLAVWQAAFPGCGITVACNVSARSLSGIGWYDSVIDAIARSGIAPSDLKLELTETAMIRVGESVRFDLLRLRDAGVAIGLDDFGTGFATLTHLRTMPVSFVKIDRSFVSGLGANADDTAIVDATVRMAEALGLSTVAEGVEEAEQAAILRDLRCNELQGYLYGRPVRSGEISELLAAEASGLRPFQRVSQMLGKQERSRPRRTFAPR